MVDREQSSYWHLTEAIRDAISFTVGDPYGDPPHNTYRLGGSQRTARGLALMVVQGFLDQGSADELAKFEADREAAIAAGGPLSSQDAESLAARAAPLETLFWSLVPFEKLPPAMLYTEDDAQAGKRVLRRHSRLPADAQVD
ncbi:MAG TPA: hypothetical protein VIL85_11940 [Thermomicrobiales bacterium]|jgi:hypothetical protein